MHLAPRHSKPRRFAAAACLLLLACLLPWRAAQANNVCVNVGGPQVIYDNPPASYPSPVPVDQVVWYGPVHVFTVRCHFASGGSLSAQGGEVWAMPYNPNTGDSSWYPNVQLGDLVNGQQIWFRGPNTANAVKLDGVYVPYCAPGVTSCLTVTFQVTEQLDMRYKPGVPKSSQNNNGFALCIRSIATGQFVGCGDGADGGPSLWLNPAGPPPQPVTPTCSFQNDNVTIPLGDIQAASLPTPGTTSPWVNGNLVSAGCTAVTQLNMTFNATADADNNNLFQAFGGATGVGIQLQAADGRPVLPNNATPLTFAPQPAGQPYSFQARYMRTSAPIKPGPGNAHITVNISYQ